MHNLDFWRTTALGVAAAGQTLFVLLYCTLPWWRTFLGRSLFSNALALAIIVDFIWLSRSFGFGRDDRVFIGLYVFLGISVWSQVIAFWRSDREKR